MPRFAKNQIRDKSSGSGKSQIRKTFKCRICDRFHPLRQCWKFLGMNTLDRMREVTLHKYCQNCLAHSHNGEPCSSKATCRICHDSHHTLLHLHEKLRKGRKDNVSKSNQSSLSTSHRPSKPSSSKSSTSQPSPAFGPSLSSVLSSGCITLFPTVVVHLVVNGKLRLVRGLIDQCSHSSRVSADLVHSLDLEPYSVADHRVCSITLQSRSEDKAQIMGVFRIDNRLTMVTPSRSVDATIKKKFPHMVLSDDEFYRSRSIEFVLGADMYTKVIQEGMILMGGPVAQNTVFGWVISGTCST